MARLTKRINPNVSIDAKGFDRMIEELARFTGKDFDDIIKHEAGRVLEGALERTNPKTKKESVDSIKARYTYKDDATDSPKRVTFAVVNGKRRRVRKIRKKGFFVMRGRGKKRRKVWDPNARNPLWRPLQAELKRLRELNLSRVGQSKGTWLYVAKRAKIKGVKAAQYIQSAVHTMTSNLKAAVNGTSGGKEKFVVIIKNYGKVAMTRGGRRRGADGFQAFKHSYNGRIGFFKENLAHGVFKKTTQITRKYKGLMVTPVTNKRTSDPVN